MGKSFLITYCLLLGQLWTLSAHAETSQFDIDRARSTVRFSLNSQLLNTTGQLSDYSGRLTLPGRDLAQSKLILAVNLDAVKFNSDSPYETIFWENLVTNLPKPKAVFTSDRVEARGPNLYAVYGRVLRGGREYQVEIPVRLLSESSEEYVFQAQLSGALDLGAEAIPNMPKLLTGGLNGKLIFRKQSAVAN